MWRSHLIRAAASLAALVQGIAPLQASAQPANWPSKPIRIIAPYAAGGGPERAVRAITAGLSARLGQPVVIDYKPGAGGNIGFADLVRSAPDGHSWLLGPDTTWTINPFVYKSTGFSQADVVPVNLVSSLVFLLACHPSTQIKSVNALAAKAKAGQVSFGSGGIGTASHVIVELLMERGGFRMTHVPYRGPGLAVSDVLGGQVDCAFVPVSAVQEHVKAGRLLGVAASTRGRAATLPEVPTLQEQGFSGFDASFHVAMFGLRSVPAKIQARFVQALDETVRSPEVREAFAANANRPEGTTAEAAQKELQRISALWQRIATRLKIELE